MDYFLESVLLFFIFFRWFTLVLGTGLIVFLIRLKTGRKSKELKWLIYVGIIVSAMTILFSLYQISGIDFGLFPDSSWF